MEKEINKPIINTLELVETPELLKQISITIERLQKEKVKLKDLEKRKWKTRENNSGQPNTLARMSINFKKMIERINNERELNGLDPLSGPKITELIIIHKSGWKVIERDLINYNTSLDKNGEEEFNEK